MLRAIGSSHRTSFPIIRKKSSFSLTYLIQKQFLWEMSALWKKQWLKSIANSHKNNGHLLIASYKANWSDHTRYGNTALFNALHMTNQGKSLSVQVCSFKQFDVSLVGFSNCCCNLSLRLCIQNTNQSTLRIVLRKREIEIELMAKLAFQLVRQRLFSHEK